MAKTHAYPAVGWDVTTSGGRGIVVAVKPRAVILRPFNEPADTIKRIVLQKTAADGIGTWIRNDADPAPTLHIPVVGRIIEVDLARGPFRGKVVSSGSWGFDIFALHEVKSAHCNATYLNPKAWRYVDLDRIPEVGKHVVVKTAHGTVHGRVSSAGPKSFAVMDPAQTWTTNFGPGDFGSWEYAVDVSRETGRLTPSLPLGVKLEQWNDGAFHTMDAEEADFTIHISSRHPELHSDSTRTMIAMFVKMLREQLK